MISAPIGEGVCQHLRGFGKRRRILQRRRTPAAIRHAADLVRGHHLWHHCRLWSDGWPGIERRVPLWILPHPQQGTIPGSQHLRAGLAWAWRNLPDHQWKRPNFGQHHAENPPRVSSGDLR
ncbi:MAG: DUF2607 family protein [Armatimonadetes bacterium]|nr:DUF2607 family protein [Armatimonadota bacterium]